MLSVTAKEIGSFQTSDVSDYTSATRMMSAVCIASHFNEKITQISIADRCVGAFLSTTGRLCPHFKAQKWYKQIPSMFFLFF